jgi:glycosyltransferase involved in cell wall biosynthesis
LLFNIVTENFVGYLKNLGTRSEIFGGAEIILYDLCRLLRCKGHTVTVIQYGNVSREFEYDGINIRQVKAPSFRVLNKFGITRRFHGGGFFWKEHLDSNVDRVHFHYYYLAYPHGDESMTGFSHGIDWDCPWYKNSYSYHDLRDRFSFHLMQKITGKVLARLKRIIANDDYFRRYVQSAYPQFAGKVSVVPNYVDTSIFHPGVQPDKAILERFGDKIRVLLPKMPARERGTDIAIRAMALLNRKNLVLLIAGDSSARPFFERMAGEYGVDDRVVFLGHRDHFSEMPGVYAAADIVIVPSPCREATALAVLEGMAVGKPVIASAIGGIPEIISSEEIGMLIRPTDTKLAGAIARLADDAETRKHIGESASTHVIRKFTQNHWIRSMAQALEIPSDTKD